MDEYEIECRECGWQGFVADLVCSDEDFASSKPASEIKFNRCPDCDAVDSCDDIDD